MARLLTGRVIGICLVTACAGAGPMTLAEAPSRPLPTPAMAGQEVTVYPLTMLLAEVQLGWDVDLAPKAEAMRKADSILGAALMSRTPEVQWVFPAALRRAAAQAPGMLPDPDRLSTAVLRGRMARLPDPLRGDMRLLTGTAGDRLALVPASLFFFADSTGGGRAELTLTLADVRAGTIGWQTVAKGTGADPWSALTSAIATLTPGLP